MTDKHCHNCKFFGYEDDSWVVGDDVDPGSFAVCEHGLIEPYEDYDDFAKTCIFFDEER